MRLKYCSEYDNFAMFLSEPVVGKEAIVMDKESWTCYLCKIINVTDEEAMTGTYEATTGTYEACFVTNDRSFFVDVDIVRQEAYPGEFIKYIVEFVYNKDKCYC